MTSLDLGKYWQLPSYFFEISIYSNSARRHCCTFIILFNVYRQISEAVYISEAWHTHISTGCYYSKVSSIL